MIDYVYIIRPYHHGFFERPTPEEEAVMKEHFQYLEKALKDGVLILAGPCLDDTFGLVIFRAADESTAQTFMFSDPSVKKNVMVAELHPMRVSLAERKSCARTISPLS